MPILIANDSRLLPQTFEGGTITSKEIDNVTFNVGQLEHASGRASSNTTGLAVAGGTQDSNQFRYAGADWKVTKDLTAAVLLCEPGRLLQAELPRPGARLPDRANQSFKTDIRYFDSSSDGKNGDAGYRFNNNGGYRQEPGRGR